MNRGLVIYSVINADGRQSEVPTKNYFDSDTAGSVLLNTVYLQGGYTNSDRNRIYLYAYGTELNTSSVPEPSAFSIVDGNGDPLTDVSVQSVQVMNKEVYTSRTNGYVLLSLNAPLPETNVSLRYEVPGTGALQDTLGNKVEAIDRRSISAANIGMTAVISDDQKFMNITMPLSDIHTNYMDIEVWMDNAKIPANQMRWLLSVNRMTAYVKLDTSVVSAGSLVVKAVEGKTLYNAAEEEIQSLKVSKIDSEEKISFVNPLYDTKEKSLSIEVNGFKDEGYGYSLFACDFVVQAVGKEYRMRGMAYYHRSSDGTWKLVFEEDCLKHIPGLGNGSIQIKYRPLVSQEGHDSLYASGKPMVATEYIDVTVIP